MEGVTDALNATAVSTSVGGSPPGSSTAAGAPGPLYERTPFPTTRLEEWRYTNLKKLLKLDAWPSRPGGSPGARRPRRAPADEPFDPASAPAALVAAMEADREAAGHVVEIDGRVVHVDLDPSLAKRRHPHLAPARGGGAPRAPGGAPGHPMPSPRTGGSSRR
jgi:hypothetical protein